MDKTFGLTRTKCIPFQALTYAITYHLFLKYQKSYNFTWTKESQTESFPNKEFLEQCEIFLATVFQNSKPSIPNSMKVNESKGEKIHEIH
jgi:hypothetical protein